MMKTNLIILAICLSGLASFPVPVPVLAQDHLQVINRYLTDDVVAIGFADLSQFDMDVISKQAVALGFCEPDELENFSDRTALVSSATESLKQAGVQRVYAFFRTSDIAVRGPSLVFPVSKGHDLSVAAKTVQEILGTLQASLPIQQVDHAQGAVLATVTPWQMERMKQGRPEQPRNYEDAWKVFSAAPIGLVVVADSDSRRVIREFFPVLPAPFNAINGSLLADRIAWAGISIDFLPSLNLSVEIQANDEMTAKLTESALVQSMESLKSYPLIDAFVPESEIEFVFESLRPIRNGKRLRISTEKLIQDQVRLVKILEPHVRAVREREATNVKRNQLRQLALGVLNYDAANRHLPAAAIVDEQGKPLLSWRVSILPFLNEMELYNEFHLDEPWDSDHNLPLAKKMPSVFADSNLSPVRRENNKRGKTVFQVPTGKGLAFDLGKELTWSDLTDGSSNTIMIASLAPRQATIWTRPADWKVDLTKPKSLLLNEGSKEIQAVFFDGSTHSLSIQVPDETLRRLIQPADGKVVGEY